MALCWGSIQCGYYQWCTKSYFGTCIGLFFLKVASGSNSAINNTCAFMKLKAMDLVGHMLTTSIYLQVERSS